MNELWGKGSVLLSDEEYENYSKRYSEWWKPHEKKIVEGMCELTHFVISPSFEPALCPMTVVSASQGRAEESQADDRHHRGHHR